MGRPVNRPRPGSRPGRQPKRTAHGSAQAGVQAGAPPEPAGLWVGPGRGEGRATTLSCGRSRPRPAHAGGEHRRRRTRCRRGRRHRGPKQDEIVAPKHGETRTGNTVSYRVPERRVRRRQTAAGDGVRGCYDLAEKGKGRGVRDGRWLTLDARCRSSVKGTVGDGVDGARRPSVGAEGDDRETAGPGDSRRPRPILSTRR